MTAPQGIPPRRPNVRARVRADLERLSQRQDSPAGFWASLNVIGAVGWPLVTAMVAGALVGRWMHAEWHTSLGVTALLVGAGAVLGMMLVWRLIQEK